MTAGTGSLLRGTFLGSFGPGTSLLSFFDCFEDYIMCRSKFSNLACVTKVLKKKCASSVHSAKHIGCASLCTMYTRNNLKYVFSKKEMQETKD